MTLVFKEQRNKRFNFHSSTSIPLYVPVYILLKGSIVNIFSDMKGANLFVLLKMWRKLYVSMIKLGQKKPG